MLHAAVNGLLTRALLPCVSDSLQYLTSCSATHRLACTTPVKHHNLFDVPQHSVSISLDLAEAQRLGSQCLNVYRSLVETIYIPWFWRRIAAMAGIVGTVAESVRPPAYVPHLHGSKLGFPILPQALRICDPTILTLFVESHAFEHARSRGSTLGDTGASCA